MKIFLILLCFSLEATVVAYLRGQFGNQLFQVAAAVALAEENHCPVYFPDFYRVPWHKKNLHIDEHNRLLFHRIPNQSPLPVKPAHIHLETGFTYAPLPYYPPSTEINGFFYSEKHFKKYEALIRQIFAISVRIDWTLKKRWKDLLAHPKTVGLHVRTGYADYQGNPNLYYSYLPPDREFYLKAIEQFDADSLFVVCSDHIPWCRKNFADIPRQFVFIENQDYIHDFYLLTKCKHNIIANSSFGWWAAYLNDNPNKKVICRHPFLLQPTPPIDMTDILCEDWIALEMPDPAPWPIFD